jgi:hypothetical protein
MLGRTVAKLFITPQTFLFFALNFLGEPLVALGLTVLFAIVALGWSRGMPRDRVGAILRKSLPPIAALLLTIGAGGGLKQTLVAAGISTTIGKIAVGAHLPLILLAWLIAVALHQATGSATVATTTAAGIVAPVVAGLSATHNFAAGARDWRGLRLFLPRERRGFLDGPRVLRPAVEADGVRLVDPADDRVGGRSGADTCHVERADLTATTCWQQLTPDWRIPRARGH